MFVAEHYVGFIMLTSLYEYTSIVILISELPVEFTKPLTDQTVKEKETLTLTCELNKPDLPVKWLKNGKEFKPTDRIQFSVDQYLHQLVITEVTLEDAAKYRCVCKDVSTTCTIKVEGIFHFILSENLLIMISVIMIIKKSLFKCSYIFGKVLLSV